MAEAKLNFTEALLDKTSSLYKLYKKLYDGMTAANKVEAPDFVTNPPMKNGEIDQEEIAKKLEEYSVILMKNSAYLFAKSIIDELGDGAISIEGLADFLVENKKAGDLIVFDGEVWKNVPKSALNLSEMNNDAGFIKAADLPSIVDADKNYTHIQGVASNSWEIQHNLGKMPTVTVVDSAYTVVEGMVVYDKDDPLNKLTINFNAVFSGVATLN